MMGIIGKPQKQQRSATNCRRAAFTVLDTFFLFFNAMIRFTPVLRRLIRVQIQRLVEADKAFAERFSEKKNSDIQSIYSYSSEHTCTQRKKLQTGNQELRVTPRIVTVKCQKYYSRAMHFNYVKKHTHIKRLLLYLQSSIMFKQTFTRVEPIEKMKAVLYFTCQKSSSCNRKDQQ